MSVLDRAALEASPLADLHAIASELSIDGYRRLRRAELIGRILESQGDESPSDAATDAEEVVEGEEEGATPRRRRGRRGGRSRAGSREDGGEAGAEDVAEAELADTDAGGDAAADEDTAPSEPTAAKAAGAARSGRRRGSASDRRRRDGDGAPSAPETEVSEPESATEERRRDAEDQMVEGVVELLPNGSGFVRVAPPEPSDDDVYISAAQVKRCELVSGDRVTGPKRTPRRSERFASLIRIDTVNDRPAEELADSGRFDELLSAFPTERIRLGSEDPTLKAIEWLTPFGRGSRVTIVGPSRAGKTEALRRLAGALTEHAELGLSLALVGVRPEEIAGWSETLPPSIAVSFAHSQDTQASAVELVVDQARRIAARGAHAVVLIDTLDGLHPHAARKLMASARNLVDRGSLTIIATASQPIGGETTVIALDLALTSSRRFPALDLATSGTLLAELLVGEPAAEAIALARAQAFDTED